MAPPRLPINEGDVYGRLTVIDATHRAVVCRCSCGAEKIIRGHHLAAGSIASCGCARRERAAQQQFKHGVGRNSDRDYRYRTWLGVRHRCLFSHRATWPHYGGRGIKMYAAWQNDPVAFITWLDENLGPRPEGHSLDRIDNDGHYEPGNLRWATRSQQARNQRRTKRS